ncbi:hypothetical protein Tco_1248131, partial [Tanacetum coccineum]
ASTEEEVLMDGLALECTIKAILGSGVDGLQRVFNYDAKVDIRRCRRRNFVLKDEVSFEAKPEKMKKEYEKTTTAYYNKQDAGDTYGITILLLDFIFEKKIDSQNNHLQTVAAAKIKHPTAELKGADADVVSFAKIKLSCIELYRNPSHSWTRLGVKQYVVHTGRVIATDSVIVAASGYVVPAAYDISPGRVNSNAKFPYLKKEEYETWAMKMEYWIMNTDHNLWNIVLQGNSRKRTGRDPRGNIMILPPVTMEEQIAVQREIKARTILLQSLPEDHMADFHHLDDAKDIWLAVKARFGGNEESKKMRKSMLKQEFADFKISESEGLHKGYDRFQKVLSQLNQMQARPDNEDCNMKFLRALPPSWSQVAITLKTKGGLDFLSFDDLYNKFRTLEIDVKGGSRYDS